MNKQDIQVMTYSELVGLVRERNRPSGGIKTIHIVATQSFLTKDKRVLEIGSNTGFTSVNLSLLTGCEVVGIDVNKESVLEAKKYAQSMNASRASFEVVDARHLPFENDSFDMVWCSNVTSFIEEKDNAISEYLRVLKVGGTLAVIPIYYISKPTAKLIKEISIAIGTKIGVWSKAFWEQIFTKTAQKTGFCLEKFFERDFKYLDRKSVLPEYLEMILSKPHLKKLDNSLRDLVRDRYTYFMTLFNENLQLAGFTIFLYQKRVNPDEAELFITEEV